MAITTAPGTTGIMGIMGIGFTVTTVIITIATNLSVEDKFNGAGSEAISSQLFFFRICDAAFAIRLPND
jgi:hypothetical protein